jgi:hypothetical protein
MPKHDLHGILETKPVIFIYIIIVGFRAESGDLAVPNTKKSYFPRLLTEQKILLH